MDEALQAFEEARACSNFPGTTRVAIILLASNLLMQGELSHATEYLQQVLSEARAEQDWGDMTSALYGLMDIAYERNDLTTMEQ